jgi:hypothetical protein
MMKGEKGCRVMDNRVKRMLEWHIKQGHTCAAAARAACCTSLDSSSARYSWARPTAEAAPKRPARAHMRCSPPLVRAHNRQAVPPASTCIALRSTYGIHIGSRLDSMQQLQKGILQIHKTIFYTLAWDFWSMPYNGCLEQ